MSALRNLGAEPYKAISIGDTKFIPTGIDSSDNITNDLMSRTITVITGQTEEGKSVIVHRTALNAIDKGYRVLIVDGEHNQDFLINKLYKMVIGNNESYFEYKKFNKHKIKEPKPHILEMLQAWHGDKLWILSKKQLNNDIKKNYVTLLAYVDKIVKTNKIDLIIYDNMMSLVSSAAAEKNEAQSEFIKAVIDMNEKHNSHSIVVTHIRKGTYDRGEDVSIYNINGTSDIPGLADNIMIVRRNFKKSHVKKDDNDIGEPDGWLGLRKVRANSIHKDIPLYYDKETDSLCEIRNGSYIVKVYNWKKEGDQLEWEQMMEPAPF